MAASRESQLERYDLIERIAVGGMAEVFLAKAHGVHGFEKTLAIKRILPELAQDREFEERFIAEAKLAVRLSHANIVQVLDFGRFGGTLFLAMEYVDGLDLAALLQRYRERARQVPLQAAFLIAVELARGLDFAHQHGVIHRDVSPSNILLSRAGEVKIADFGIAVPDAQELRRPSRQRRIMGKWRYMSPEQTRGESLQTRSDLFSAAAVMFELFTGDKLFPGDEPEAIIQNIHRMDIPSAAERRPELPPRLDTVLRAALARDPAERPGRAAEMQRALAEISYESSIVATALDVAEAVALVLAPEETTPRVQRAAGPMDLDRLIRQQLGAAGEGTERHTAVTGGTAPAAPDARRSRFPEVAADQAAAMAGDPGNRPATLVKTGVGADGLTVWNLGDVARAPPPEAGAGDSGAMAVQGISAGRRVAALAISFAVMAGMTAVIAWWLVGRQAMILPPPVLIDAAPARDAGPTAPADAAAPAQVPLFVMSTPPGAAVWIDGQPVDEVTPAAVRVSAGAPHRVALVLDGYARYVEDEVVVLAEEPGRVSATLVPEHVSLVVDTTPSGAVVRLGGRSLGTTPLSVDLPLTLLERDLGGRALVLTIAKKGYQSVTVGPLQPKPGTPLRIERSLQAAAPRHGTIQIYVDNSWADIYLGADKIGRAPVGALRLPVGKHTLRLHNPVSGRESSLDVTVDPARQNYYRLSL